jgi:hypothetical protein
MNTVLVGVLLQLLALALFVAMDTLLKLMTLSFAVPQLMWARFLFSFIAVTIAMRVITGSLPWRSRAPGLQTIRSLLLAACVTSPAETDRLDTAAMVKMVNGGQAETLFRQSRLPFLLDCRPAARQVVGCFRAPLARRSERARLDPRTHAPFPDPRRRRARWPGG